MEINFLKNRNICLEEQSWIYATKRELMNISEQLISVRFEMIYSTSSATRPDANGDSFKNFNGPLLLTGEHAKKSRSNMQIARQKEKLVCDSGRAPCCPIFSLAGKFESTRKVHW